MTYHQLILESKQYLSLSRSLEAEGLKVSAAIAKQVAQQIIQLHNRKIIEDVSKEYSPQIEEAKARGDIVLARALEDNVVEIILDCMSEE